LVLSDQVKTSGWSPLVLI